MQTIKKIKDKYGTEVKAYKRRAGRRADGVIVDASWWHLYQLRHRYDSPEGLFRVILDPHSNQAVLLPPATIGKRRTR